MRLSALSWTGFLLLLLIGGCGLLGGNDDDMELQVVAGEGFDQNWVTVSFDGDTVIADTLSFGQSEPIYIPAAETRTILERGEHQLQVTVDEQITDTFEFSIPNVRSIWITFDHEADSISFETFDHIVIYEG